MLRELTICGRERPLGLDERPRFSWKITSDRSNVTQASYRITVKAGPAAVWDSGEVLSDQSVHVLYDGEDLQPFTEYQVQITAVDNYGDLHEGITRFETGLIHEDNWQAQWITHDLPEAAQVPYFKKKLGPEAARGLKRARVYASACGVYDILINGRKLGDAFLAPGWTSYYSRIQYQTYDATKAILDAAAGDPSAAAEYAAEEGEAHDVEENHSLAGGDICVEVPVADGWYAGYLNADGEKGFYGSRMALILMIRLEYGDGSVRVIGTDADWTVSDGDIRFGEIYHGETQDFTAAAAPERASVLCDVGGEGKYALKVGHLTAQVSEPVRITESRPAETILITPAGESVLDFGQNMAGFVEVVLPEPAEGADTAKLIIRHAETLDRDGNFYTENLRTARATDTYVYTASQAGLRVHPHFTYHGFRYISVEAENCEIRKENFTALTLHTDMKRTGTFVCDNPEVNRLHDNILWGQNSNFVDLPTDCPQRDERLGWTGDAQIFCATGSWLYDTEAFFRKWLADVAADSSPEYGVPHYVPNFTGPTVGTAVWGDCATIIPWQLYESYGDAAVLAEHYPLMKLWTEYIRRQCGGEVLWLNGFQRGDWLALDAPACRPGLMSGGTDKNLVANVYYALAVRLTAKAAAVTGRSDEAAEYEALYEKIREALNTEFVTATGRLVSETQTACVLLLHFDLLKPEYRDRVMKTLEGNLTDNRNHLTTGFVGTAFLCHALTENGRHDLAEKVFLQTDYPSWLYQVKKGATTIWERWNSIAEDGSFDQSGMNSLNHYSYGAIGDWMYRKIAGINPARPGYKEIRIQPYLTHGMTQVSASLDTPYGVVSVFWSCRGGKINVDVTVPVNTTARLILPEKDGELLLGSGTYHYSYDTDTQLLPGKYSDDTVVGSILEDEKAAEIFYEVIPGMRGNPALGYIRLQTIGKLRGMSAEMAPAFDALLKRLNAIPPQ